MGRGEHGLQPGQGLGQGPGDRAGELGLVPADGDGLGGHAGTEPTERGDQPVDTCSGGRQLCRTDVAQPGSGPTAASRDRAAPATRRRRHGAGRSASPGSRSGRAAPSARSSRPGRRWTSTGPAAASSRPFRPRKKECSAIRSSCRTGPRSTPRTSGPKSARTGAARASPRVRTRCQLGAGRRPPRAAELGQLVPGDRSGQADRPGRSAVTRWMRGATARAHPV